MVSVHQAPNLARLNVMVDIQRRRAIRNLHLHLAIRNQANQKWHRQGLSLLSLRAAFSILGGAIDLASDLIHQTNTDDFHDFLFGLHQVQEFQQLLNCNPVAKNLSAHCREHQQQRQSHHD